MIDDYFITHERMKMILGADSEHDSMRPADLLGRLRAKLDCIDERSLDGLRERIECCVQIVHYKRKHGVPMMQPHRIGIVQQRAARYAENHGIDQDFLCRLYELIIAETCQVENLAIGDVTGASAEHLTSDPQAARGGTSKCERS
ncbi:MAG: chorismate mutase family protein [Pseudonocardiaceae bacterium]